MREADEFRSPSPASLACIDQIIASVNTDIWKVFRRLKEAAGAHAPQHLTVHICAPEHRSANLHK
jgi:hypothetical protein